MRAIRRELVSFRADVESLRQLFDQFAGVFLNAKFPYGKATDRWGRD